MRCALLSLLLLAACGAPKAPTAPSGPVLGQGPYHFVSVAALGLEGETARLRISNDGQFAACLIGASIPHDDYAGHVRVFRASGAERRNLGSVITQADTMAVHRLEPAASLDVTAHLHGLRNGDCVAFEPIYEPCLFVHDNQVDATLGLPADKMGVAQGVWRVRDGALVAASADDSRCNASTTNGVR